MSEAPPQPSAFPRRLAMLALVFPLLALLLIALHAGWLSRSEGLREQRAIFSWAGRAALTLTPAGRPPREGPGSHRAIDRRHTPRMPASKAGGAR